MAGELTSVVVRDNTTIDPQSDIGADGSGWVVDCVLDGITDTGGTVDPSKLVFNVTDPGFTANGAATTVSREIRGGAFIRRRFPNGNSRMITTDDVDLTLLISLHEVIYAGTTINSVSIEDGFYPAATAGAAGSIINDSTQAYHKPVGSWLNFQGLHHTSDSVEVEFCAGSITAREGQQVACVEFYADDGATVGPSVYANAPTLSTLQTMGYVPECFAATVDLTDQTQAAMTTVNAKVYPHIGDSSAVMDLAVDGTSWPTSLPLTPLRVFCDSGLTYGGAYAYIDGVGAGSPTVSSDPVVASANPYASLSTAMSAVRAWNNTNKGHNDNGGAIVRYKNDTESVVTYALGGSSGNNPGSASFTVERDPAATVGVILESTTQSSHASGLLWRNIEHKSGASNYTLLGYSSGGSPASTTYFENCAADNTADKNFMGWTSYRYFRNYTLKGGEDIGVLALGPDDRAVALFAGVVSEASASVITGAFAHSTIGCHMPDYRIELSGTADGDDGMFVYNNRLKAMFLRNTSATTINQGVANIQNIYELPAGASAICMNAFADGDLTTISQYIDFHNTAVGERASRFYNDVAATHVTPHGVKKLGSSKYSIVDNWNQKADYFLNGNGAGDVGAWRYAYSVGNVGNVSLFGSVQRNNTSAPANDATDTYLGFYWPASSTPNLYALGGTQDEIMDLFVDYVAPPRSVPSVGSDLHLTAEATAFMDRVPAGMSVLRYDLDGVPRKTNGTGAAGAYELYTTPPVSLAGIPVRTLSEVSDSTNSINMIDYTGSAEDTPRKSAYQPIVCRITDHDDDNPLDDYDVAGAAIFVSRRVGAPWTKDSNVLEKVIAVAHTDPVANPTPSNVTVLFPNFDYS